MVVIASLAIIMETEKTRRRWSRYREEASLNEWSERTMRSYADEPMGYCAFGHLSEEARRRLETNHRNWCIRQAAYYARLKRKYRRAAWRPWESVAPDPPA